MTTPALVRAAWASTVWTDPAVIAFTPNIFDHEITLESGNDLADLNVDGNIKFFTYLVNRAGQLEQMGMITRYYPVEVCFWIQQFMDGVNQQNTVVDAFAAVENAIFTRLGHDWQHTIKYFELQKTPIKIVSGKIGSVPVWKGSFVYTALERIQIS